MKLIDKMIEQQTSIDILKKQIEELEKKFSINYHQLKEENKILIWHSIDTRGFWFEDDGVRNSSYTMRYDSMLKCLRAVKQFLGKEK